MVRMLSIYLLILFAGALTWYITQQLKEAYTSLKASGTMSAARPIFLFLTFGIFLLAAIQSFFESPEDVASHGLLIVAALALAFALSINKASLKDFTIQSKRYYLKLKMAVAYQLIKFGKKK